MNILRNCWKLTEFLRAYPCLKNKLVLYSFVILLSIPEYAEPFTLEKW